MWEIFLGEIFLNIKSFHRKNTRFNNTRTGAAAGATQTSANSEILMKGENLGKHGEKQPCNWN